MERMTEKQVAKNTIEKLAIVVVTYRRQQLLATLFESIEKLTVAPWRIIVVDNEHSEATQGMVDDFREAVTAQWGNTIADHKDRSCFILLNRRRRRLLRRCEEGIRAGCGVVLGDGRRRGRDARGH